MATIEKRTWTVRIGKDFVKILTFTTDGTTPIDITGYSFKMQIRKCKNSATVIQELTSPSGGIVLTDAANGKITISITDTQSAAYKEENAVFDLQWTTSAGIIQTILEGNIQILETVTK